MSFGRQHNIAVDISPVRASDNVAQTAGGAGDNTQVVGQIIDRSAFQYPLSAAVVITTKAVLAASKTQSFLGVLIEHGDAANLSDAATFLAPADVVVLTDSGSGSTLRGQQKYAVDLSGAKRYVRLKFTPDLNAANTDTAECAAVWIFGGEDTGVAA